MDFICINLVFKIPFLDDGKEGTMVEWRGGSLLRHPLVPPAPPNSSDIRPLCLTVTLWLDNL